MKRKISILLCAALVSAALPAVSNTEVKAADFSAQLQEMISENMGDYVSAIRFQIGNTNYTVDGASRNLRDNVAPDIMNDSTMLPMRAIAEALGGSADFKESTGEIIIQKDDTTLTMKNGDNSVAVDTGNTSATVESGVAPTIVDGTTLVPVRMVSELLGTSVQWEAADRTVTITPDYQTKRLIVLSKNNKKLDFERFNPKKVIDNGEGLYVVQFNTNIGDATIKAYCEQIEAMSNTEAADPDIVFVSSGSGSFAGGQSIRYTNLDTYASKIKEAGNLSKVEVGIVEFGKYNANNNFSSSVQFKNPGSGSAQDAEHATLDTAIIEAGIQGIGNENYDLNCYVCTSSDLTRNSEGDCTFSSALQLSIDDAERDGCCILNMSLEAPTTADNLENLSKKISECGDMLFVCAAGNCTGGYPSYSSSDEFGYYPGAFSNSHSNVLTVAATDENDSPYGDSNYGRNVKIAAPGVGVSVFGVGAMSGTSQAAPHITAAAALIKAQNSAYSPDRLISELTSGNYTVPIQNAGDHHYGVGTLRMPAGSSESRTEPPTETATALPGATPTATPAAQNITQPPTAAPGAEITSYEFSASSAEINVGDSFTIQAYAVYNDGSRQDVTSSVGWTTTNESVASVSKGIVKGISAGTARINISFAASASLSMPRAVTITVKEAENHSTTPSENVTPAPSVQSDEIVSYRWADDSTITLAPGGSASVKLYAVYRSGKEVDVTSTANLASSDESVVTVTSGGKLKAIGSGRARISMGTASSASATIPSPITVVVEKSISGYEWSDSSFTLTVGESANVKLYAVYNDGSRQDVTASAGLISSDDSIAKVTDSGMIIAVGEGSARISMSAASSASISVPKPITVKVSAAPGSASSGSVMYGDVNSDGKVNNKDVTALQKYIAGSASLSSEQMKAADVNGDGNVDDTDLGLLKKKVMGILSAFPVEN